MKNTFGNSISMTIFGESHGPAIGAILDGLPAGFEVSIEEMNHDLDKRKPRGKTGTARRELDQVEIVSGLFNNRTTGTPLTLIIKNGNTRSSDYDKLKDRLRPGHADFTAFEKYHGYQDYRGGGHFSGRITAAVVAAGSICRQILASKGVRIGTHILNLHGLSDRPFDFSLENLNQQIKELNEKLFPVLDPAAEAEMIKAIEKAAFEKNSIGGILQTAVTGLPAGIGEPFFDSVESELAHLLFSVPGLKSVAFGAGEAFAQMTGSEANDELIVDNGIIRTGTNNNGGINGGITNGMPVLFHCTMKPTPSIYLPQRSVSYSTKEKVELTIEGRHDPAIIHRARAVVDAVTAFGILDLWMTSLETTIINKSE